MQVNQTPSASASSSQTARKRKRLRRSHNPKSEHYQTPSDEPTGLIGSPPRRHPLPLARRPLFLPSPPVPLKYLNIWWDGENEPIPVRMYHSKFRRQLIIDALNNFKARVRSLGYQIGKFRVFQVTMTKFYRKIFRECGLTVHIVKPDVEYPKRDHVDVKIEDFMNIWAVSAPLGSHVMLIANDQDYIRVICRLQRCGYIVHLAANPSSTCEPASVVKQPVLDWHNMLFSAPSMAYSDNRQPVERPLRLLHIYSSDKLLVNVLWDLKTCPIPQGIKIEEIKDQITKALQELNYGGVYKMQCFDQAEKKTQSCPTLRRGATREALRDIGFQCLLAPKKGAHKRDHVDVRIRKLICLWAVTREPPSPILLISEDRRLRYTVKKICKQQFEILLGHSGSAPASLKKKSTKVLLVNDILSGIGREDRGEDQQETQT